MKLFSENDCYKAVNFISNKLSKNPYYIGKLKKNLERLFKSSIKTKSFCSSN